MKAQLKLVWTYFVGLAGLLFVIAGCAVSNTVIEKSMQSDSSRSLSWGPTLFRLLLVVHGLALIIAAARLVKTWARKTPQTNKATLNWYPWAVLIALSLVAFALRMWRLNTDLWYDELVTLLNFVRMPLGDILTRLPDQNNHILFSVLSHASVSIFGESPWAVRLPSVIFGVASIWALFLLGRRMVSTVEALAACALMTFSYHHIWFSQNARGYMALLFFSVLATWLWLEALRRDRWSWWIGYALTVAAGMWTHMTMVFIVAAHFLVYVATVITSKQNHKLKLFFTSRSFGAFLLSATVTLQLYALALPEFLSAGLHEVSLESEWTNPWWVVTETFKNLRIGFSGAAVVLAGGVMLGLGWWSLVRREWQSALLIVLPPILAAVAMVALGHNIWPRFFFFSMGFALLIAIHGASELPKRISKFLTAWPGHTRLVQPAGYALASLMILASAITVPRNYAHPKQDYSGARDYVESHRNPNDAVVAVGLAGMVYKNYFAPTWSVAQTQSELDAVRSKSDNVWLVYTIPVEVKAYRRDVWQTIQSDFSVVKVFPGTLAGGEVVVCRESLHGPHLAKR